MRFCCEIDAILVRSSNKGTIQQLKQRGVADAMPKLRTKARPTSNLPKFLHIIKVDDLLDTKSEDVGLIVHAISFQDFQPMWS